jgi:hypothetical protein
VDEDATQAYEDYVSEVLLGRLIESTGFRLMILLCILFNAVLIGVETNHSLVRAPDRFCLYLFTQTYLTLFFP